MKKIIQDVFKYILGTADFSLVTQSNSGFLYPICLNFTLENNRFYYNLLDDNGIPYRFYQSVGVQYNPTRIAAYGLAHFNRYIDNAFDNDKEIFMKCANWFLDLDNARYEYNFDWGQLKSPWISCMAQGEAASLLIRAYKLTGEDKYLLQAEKSLTPLFLPITEGGVQSVLPDGSIFLEEYPSLKPTHVLNGFLYALIGLGEYIDVTGSKVHQDLFDKLVNSLCQNISIWCYAGWSLYEDSVKAKGLNFCTPSYHNLQITQLKWLNKRVNNPDIQRVIEVWEKGLNSFLMRVFALLGKVCFRLKNKAQR
ncbi:D-glucuronyl C5-epimerase [Vibrio cholerae]|uniref:D-glucuronyl C5-epimerase family protein n=1 Tax=Vibrio cholerae TaxID=666 RepID=UPI000A0FBFA0|nr:D-glucuronyl C5-epimerase family protein [Vibrio cholerae]EGR1056634.1 D-glucuronyl C5-epimerase [Vibrio cholerae]EGR4401970.1 D-glucuronyl C5-epimerase [Vibrio cholerae]EHE0026238.1 D-glucuronyl C5-epimerase [Vibrio cholerae]EJL6259953.1 D-glucuronyl C5-epimerase [Vibrio cholerae]EKF9385388.1 D-glucuronyl C5-epimerase [Vibrio cholerae]